MNPSTMTDKELLVSLCGPEAANALANKTLADLFGISVDINARPGAEECVSKYMAFPQIHVAKELLTRALSVQMQSSEVFGNPTAIKDYLRLKIAHLSYEAFGVMYLDAMLRLIDCEVLFRGSLSQTSVYPRELVRGALAKNAASVVLFHNHPSGSLEPSRADQTLTDTLKSALNTVDVRVLDHIIVSSYGAQSMATLGLL